jgi:hypothetical protein
MAVEVDKSINEKGREQEYELATDSIDNWDSCPIYHLEHWVLSDWL